MPAGPIIGTHAVSPSARRRVLAAVPDLFFAPRPPPGGALWNSSPTRRSAATRKAQAPSALATLDLHAKDAIACDTRTEAVHGIKDDRDPDGPALSMPNLRPQEGVLVISDSLKLKARAVNPHSPRSRKCRPAAQTNCWRRLPSGARSSRAVDRHPQRRSGRQACHSRLPRLAGPVTGRVCQKGVARELNMPRSR